MRIPTLLLLAGALHADSLPQLAADFWNWRAAQQPASGDDIPRIDRPAGWTPDWSPAAVARMRARLAEFERRWRALPRIGLKPEEETDLALMGSAVQRVKWELDYTQGWRRNPLFYVHQTLGTVFELLLEPPPFAPERAREIAARCAAMPRTLEAARANLTDMRRPFGRLAVEELADIRPRLATVARELAPFGVKMAAEAEKAAEALEAFRGWIETRLAALPEATAAGEPAYRFFLKEVALLDLTPAEILAIGRREWERAVAFETLERIRNQAVPELALPADAAAQIEKQARGEDMVRYYLELRGVMSFPPSLKRYKNLPLPAYLAPLRSLGVTDDLTSPARLQMDGVSYIPDPQGKLGYFALAAARDPRTLIAHEGVHYYQLALGYAHPNPVRRHYYDSSANEGLAFYTEEMMLQAGVFDDSPRSREILYNFARLRALRVEVDVKLATGEFTIEQAGEYLREMVPMDRETASSEAASFASTPGQAISYQIGKTQILGFLARARRQLGARFDLRDFHDYLLRNGNVPIALLEREYLRRR
jgi:uncharacterized protein (DUF885 family)